MGPRTPGARPEAAFTIVELALALALSAIVLVGLAVLLDVPSRFLAHHQATPALASVDRALHVLDQDVRYASDVQLTGSTSLLVRSAGGATVVYEWGGASGAPLLRRDAQGVVEILPAVHHLAFELEQSALASDGAPGALLAGTATEVAGFDAFELLPGYELVSGVFGHLGLGAVSLELGALGISGAHRAGIHFIAEGPALQTAKPSALRLRLRRDGAEDLAIRLHEATEEGFGPAPGAPLAKGYLSNGALPSSFQWIDVPLVGAKKLQPGSSYFLEIAADGPGRAAQLETRALSLGAAAAPATCGLFEATGAGKGSLFHAIGDPVFNGQTAFSLVATVGEAEPAHQAVAVTVPVAVRLKLKLAAEDPEAGTDVLATSFVLLNNLALADP